MGANFNITREISDWEGRDYNPTYQLKRFS